MNDSVIELLKYPDSLEINNTLPSCVEKNVITLKKNGNVLFLITSADFMDWLLQDEG